MNWPPTLLQLFILASLPLLGLLYAFLGGIKLPLAERLKLDEGKAGGLVAGFGMMVGPTILACGFLTDAFGTRGVALAGFAIAALALLLLAGVRTYRGALATILLLGAGWSAAINVANVLMGQAAAPGKLTQMMQFGDFLFGFGAFATPALLGILLARCGYPGALRWIALSLALPLALCALAPMAGPAGAGPNAPAGTLGQLFSGRTFWLTSLAFLFFVPLESSVAGWATTLIARNSPGDPALRRLAGRGLTAFWLCFTGSRLLVAATGIEHGRDLLLLVLAACCIPLMIGISRVPGGLPAVVLVALAGLVFGPIFPVLISKILGSAPKGVEGRAVGFFFAFGSVGWTFIPRLIGLVAVRSTVQRGFLVAAASGALFAILVVIQQFAGRTAVYSGP